MVFIIISLFILGTIFGSFLGVIIYRIRKNKKGIFFGRSECEHCHKKLKPLDLIPILSYVIKLGKCRYCKKKIGMHHLILEVVCGLLFVAFFLFAPFIAFSSDLKLIIFNLLLLKYIFNIIVGLALVGIFFYDIRYMEIPELFTIPIIIVIALSAFMFPDPGFVSMMIGGAIGGLFFWIQEYLSKETWIGKGDTQVGILIGLLLGWQMLLIALMAMYIIGLIVSVGLMAFKLVTVKSRIPFAPFMVSATFIVMFFGNQILDFYLNLLY